MASLTHPKRISDRKMHIATSGPVIEPSPGSECSQEPASPSGTELMPPPAIPKFSRMYLRRQHPSLEIIGQRIRQATDQSTLRSFVLVFVQVVQNNIVPSLSALPFIDKADDEYRAREFMVAHKCCLLIEQANKQAMHSQTPAIIIAKAVTLLDLIIDALYELVHVAQHLFFAGKPLPIIPPAPTTALSIATSDESTYDALRVSRRSLNTIVEEVLSEELGSVEPSALRSSIASYILIEPPDRKVHFADPSSHTPRTNPIKLSVPQGIYKLRQIVRSASSLTLRSTSSKSSRSLIPGLEFDDEKQSVSYRDQSSVKSVKVPYSFRQSLLFAFTEGEERPIMPMPACDEIMINQDGKVMQSTFDGLFAQVTSNLVLEQPYLIPFFFHCFRYWSSSVELAAKLEARFIEEPPDELTPEQLRVWVRSNEGTKHRVRNLLHTWLQFYWEPTLDEPALAPLLQFTLGVLGQLNDASTLQVFNMVIDASSGIRTRCMHFKHFREAISKSNIVEQAKSAGFRFSPERCSSDKKIADLKVFNSENGRLELARQITVRCTALFNGLDAAQIVKFWFLNAPPVHKVNDALVSLHDLSRRLALFVTHSVLEDSTTSVQVTMLEFWLDVCMECLRLNNFLGVAAIFTGLDTASVSRLKKVVMSVDFPHKMIYQIVTKLLFSDNNNRHYRHVVSSLKDHVRPHIPILDCFGKDLSGAKAVYDLSMTSRPSPNTINFVPFHTIHAAIEAIEASQVLQHKFTSSSAIQIWFDQQLQPFTASNSSDILYQKSLEQYATDPEWRWITNAWNYMYYSNKKIEPVAPLRVDLDKIFGIHHHDPYPDATRQRRATLAVLQLTAR